MRSGPTTTGCCGTSVPNREELPDREWSRWNAELPLKELQSKQVTVGVVDLGEDAERARPASGGGRLVTSAEFDVAGPLVIEEVSSTTIVLPTQRVFVDKFGLLHITEAR